MSKARSLHIAIYQASCPHDVPSNIGLVEKVAQAASSHLVDLIIFNELFLTGYSVGDDLVRLAEPQDGPSSKRIAEIARRNNVAIVYGYSERADEGTIYNSALFIDRLGYIAANYRKIHLWGEMEHSYFTPGKDWAPLVTINGVNVGVLICYDVEFPEATRILALRGADIIAVPTAIASLGNINSVVVPARALENGIFVCYVNRRGKEDNGVEFHGGSTIAGPNGEIIAMMDSDRMPNTDIVTSLSDIAGQPLVMAKLRLEHPPYISYKERNPYLTDRRPECYGDLAKLRNHSG